MDNNVLEDKVKIEDLIYEVRGKQVMLDSDLARLYECTNGTKDINKAVRRNINRFPEKFMFQLTDEEYNDLRFQFGTSKLRGGRRYNPYVFTEQGVAMLSSVLHSEIAIYMSIQIIEAFVTMRKYVSNNLIEQKYVNKLVYKHESEIELLKNSFEKIDKKRKVNEIYFSGQIYDAYYTIQEIFKKAEKELVIIDTYSDNTILDIIKRLDINVIIITKPNNLLTDQDIIKYNKQYHNLKVIFESTFHDRYFILDRKEVYHCGASINRIGYKTFSINYISDEDTYRELIKKIGKLISY